MSAAIAELGFSLLPNMWEGARLKTDPDSPLTCVEAALVSGAVAVNGEGGASEGVGCCCCDNSEPAPPAAMAPVPDDDPSAPEKTPGPVVVELLLLCRLPFLRSDGDF